jgi:hypothetical protein
VRGSPFSFGSTSGLEGPNDPGFVSTAWTLAAALRAIERSNHSLSGRVLMYVSSDPRSKLAPSNEAKSSPRQSSANYVRFYDREPDQSSSQIRSWYARAQNFVTVYSEAEAGAIFSRVDQPDEFAVLLPDPQSRVVVKSGVESVEVGGHSIIFVPPGNSTIEVTATGRVIQLFSIAAADIVAACPSGYEEDPNVPPLEPWPEPLGGYRIRHYSMDIPAQQGRLGRIFRSRNFMINYIYPRSGPRDRSGMSPHSHADFQQCSMSLEGTYVHHLRWPWGNDANLWREDEHALCQSPSVTIIPAQVVHTSEAVGADTNFLVDIFCPPREDFSKQPGWVLNADDYPEPIAS